MENKSTDQLNMDLPPYTTSPHSRGSRKYWIVGFSLALLLAVIIVVGTLIGVFMTQKHTEELVTLTLSNAEGEKIQQTVSFNEKNNMAAFYVVSDKFNGTFLFDYNKKLIASRKPLSSQCLVMNMNETKTPTLKELQKELEYLRIHNAPENDRISSSIIKGEEANPAEVGSYVYLLCSDATIYWAKKSLYFSKGNLYVEELEETGSRSQDMVEVDKQPNQVQSKV